MFLLYPVVFLSFKSTSNSFNMTWKHFFTSSIGKKLIMGLTGLFLISFLIVHCTINAMIFYNDGGQTFNHWGHFMGSNIFIRTFEIGLFAGLILHSVQGLVLWRQNAKARPVKYAVNKPQANSKWYSRSMGLLGTLLLLFLVLHMYHFWVPSRFGGMANVQLLETTTLGDYADQEAHNLYKAMITDPGALGCCCLRTRSDFTFLAFGARVSKCIPNLWVKP